MNNQYAIDAAATLAKITELCVNNQPVPTGLIMKYGDECFSAGKQDAANGYKDHRAFKMLSSL